MIGVLNIGLGNIRSVFNAIYENGYDPVYIEDPESLKECSHIVVPGVGNFSAVMGLMNEGGYTELLKAHVAAGKPFLGICLGMQLMATYGEEGDGADGLGFIPASVKKLNLDKGWRIPHVGWNTVTFKQTHPVLKGIKPGRDFYFVHSFAMECEEDQKVLGVTHYSKDITCAVAHGSAIGLQFHPEKSQRNGLLILENFCEWDGTC